jgi:hypothetical protein
LIESTFLMSRPLHSTPTPASRSFTATTGQSASERRIGTQCLRFQPRHAPLRDLWGLRPRTPYRRSPSHVPCKSRRPGSRRLYAGHHPARNAGTRQAHLEGWKRTLDFDVILVGSRRLNDDAPPGLPGRALLERLPGPHLTQSSHAFSLSLSTTVFSQRTTGRFSARPRRANAGGPTSLHLSHSTTYEQRLLHIFLPGVHDALPAPGSACAHTTLAAGS